MFCLMAVYWDQRWRQGTRGVKAWLVTALLLGFALLPFLHDTDLTRKTAGVTLPAEMDPLRRVRGTLNPALDIAGVLLTMYDERTNLGQQVAKDIREFFEDRVYQNVIPRNIRLGEAPSHGLPAILYDVKSRGSEAYLTLAREVLARETAAPQTEQNHG